MSHISLYRTPTGKIVPLDREPDESDKRQLQPWELPGFDSGDLRHFVADLLLPDTSRPFVKYVYDLLAHSDTALQDELRLKLAEKLGYASTGELVKKYRLINPKEKAAEPGTQEDIIQLLDEPEAEAKYLDIGYTDNVFYYGLNLAGREAIVTSDKRILRNTEERLKEGRIIGENQIKDIVEYSGYIGDIAPTITKSAIKRWLISPEPLDKKQIYDVVKAKILFYMDFGSKPEMADVQACWTIATHCYPLFYWFPHILFNAPSESGKSKNADIILMLAFRGYDLGTSGGVTPPQIFRTLEGNRGTIKIDEFEKQEKSETQQLVNQVLNASAAKDAYVIRTEQIDKKWRAWRFHIFCPKVVCNITGINPTSLSRFITFQLFKTLDKTKGRRNPLREADKKTFPAIRDSISLLILQEWKEIKETYDTLELDLTNRDADNWMPLCAIAKWLGDDVLERVLSYIKTYKEIRIEGNDLTETLFRVLYENLPEERRPYTPKEMAHWLEDDLSSFKSPASWIGRQLKNYQIRPTGRSGTGKVYRLCKADIKNIIDRYFSTTEDAQATQDTLPTEDTQATLKSSLNEEKNVACVSSVSFTKVNDPVFDVILPCVNFDRCKGIQCATTGTPSGRPYCRVCYKVLLKDESLKVVS